MVLVCCICIIVWVDLIVGGLVLLFSVLGGCNYIIAGFLGGDLFWFCCFCWFMVRVSFWIFISGCLGLFCVLNVCNLLFPTF